MTMSPPDGLMIADDLTGALDSSVPFAERGWRVQVIHWRSLERSRRLFAERGAGPVLLVVDTESRNLEPDAAAARIEDVAAALLPLPASTFVFKKIDSRLKGNVAAEVQALAAGLHRGEVLFCPAVPEAGRVVEAGVFKDVASAATVKLPPLGGSLNISCPDARTGADLDSLARAFCGSATRDVAVGARGLAESLAKALAPARGAAPAPAPELPVCFIIGTNDPVTVAQLEHLRHATPDHREHLFPDEGRPVALRTSCLALRLAATSPADFVRLLPGFVRWANAIASEVEARTLVVSGGDTLRAFADAVGWTGFVPLRSFGGGLVLAAPVGGVGRLVVSKSGGFGHLSAFSDLLALAGPRR